MTSGSGVDESLACEKSGAGNVTSPNPIANVCLVLLDEEYPLLNPTERSKEEGRRKEAKSTIKKVKGKFRVGQNPRERSL